MDLASLELIETRFSKRTIFSPFKFLDFIDDVKVGWTLTDERELNYRVETIKMIFLFVISRYLSIYSRNFEIREGRIGIVRSERRIKSRIEEFDWEVSIRPRFEEGVAYVKIRVIGNSRHAKRDRVRTDEMSGSNLSTLKILNSLKNKKKETKNLVDPLMKSKNAR